jgi:hypothetical protein
MAIETDFSFAQVIPKTAALAPVDLLGPLRPMVGPKPANPKNKTPSESGKDTGSI